MSLAAVTVSGIIVARGLGETGRGQYAAVVSWYNVGLVLGEVGQSTALTFFNSRRPSGVRESVRLSQRIMLIASGTVCILGEALSPMLSGGDPGALTAYRLAFLGLPLNGLLGPYLYSFQAFRLSTWNILRGIQPILNVIAILMLMLISKISLSGAVFCLLASTVCQLLLAVVSFRRAHGATEGALVSASPLLAYGIKQAGSAVPSILASNLDRLYLSQAVVPAQLGRYAVAQSLMSVASGLGSGIASVAFPSFAARSGSVGRRAAEWRVVGMSVLGVLPLVVLLVIAAPRLIPWVFGAEFAGSVPLTIWLAPAAVAQNLVIVMGALLRGRGLPGRAALANVLALISSATVMMIAVPRLGVSGAAVGSLVGSCSAILIMAIVLMRRPPLAT